MQFGFVKYSSKLDNGKLHAEIIEQIMFDTNKSKFAYYFKFIKYHFEKIYNLIDNYKFGIKKRFDDIDLTKLYDFLHKNHLFDNKNRVNVAEIISKYLIPNGFKYINSDIDDIIILFLMCPELKQITKSTGE